MRPLFLAALLCAPAAAAPTTPRYSPKERLVAALGLKRAECPVPMYSGKSWLQGSYHGRMVGYDGRQLWLGTVDEATRCVFKRDLPRLKKILSASQETA